MKGKRTLSLLMGLCVLGTLIWAGTEDRASFSLSQETGKPTAAQDDTRKTAPTEFEIALKTAADNLKLKRGKRYDETFGRSLALWLGPAMVRWTSDIPTATDVEPFTVLIRVGASGAAEEVLAWPDTKVAQRLKAEFPAAGLPKPPGPSWWVKLDVRVELRDDNRGGKGQKPAYPQYGAVEGSGIVYGGDLGIIISAPEGWALDNKSGVSQGTHAVMYPKGSSWNKASEVMYVNIGEMGSLQSLEAFIADDIKRFKQKFPRIHVEGLDPVNTTSGPQAQVRAFSGGGYRNYECVAYAQHGSRVGIYVLTCRSKKGLGKTLGLFKEMVAKSESIKLRSNSSALLEDQVANGVAVDDEPGHAVLRVPLEDDHRDGR